MRIILLILISILTSQFVAMSQEKNYPQLERKQPTDTNVIHKEKLSFDVKYIDKLGFVATDKKGEFLFEIFPYDNGPDYPSEGFIRIRENGKIGYANLDGDIVIPPSFQFAYPFQNGYALICKGGMLIKDGEHSEWKDAKWGAIDKEGTIIIKPFNLGIFTMDILDLKLHLQQHFSGQFEIQCRKCEPKQIDFFVSGEEGGLFIDIYSATTAKQLMVYLFLPWQDLNKKTSSIDDVMIPTEQLVTVTHKYIIYQVYVAPLLSNEEMDDIRKLTELIRKFLGYEQTQHLLQEEDGVTSSTGLQIISLNEYPNYVELSVATPGTGFVSPDIVRNEFPNKMVLLHQIPDVGKISSNWIKPNLTKNYPIQ